MSLSREKIVEELVKICGEEAVVTDIEVLQESSYDRFRKYEGYNMKRTSSKAGKAICLVSPT